MLLNPSGIPHPDGLVALRARYSAMADLSNIGISRRISAMPPQVDIFAGQELMQGGNFNFSRENANPELLNGAKVSSGYFDVFEAQSLSGPGVHAGRRPARQPEHEVVLSYDTWKKHFGSDPNIVGRTLMLNQQPYRVVGVMGPDFNWPNQAEVWVPIALPSVALSRSERPLQRIPFGACAAEARRQPEQANAYLDMKTQQNIGSGRSAGSTRATARPPAGACSPCR